MYFKKADANNFTAGTRTKDSIDFIVVHYTAGNGDTARNNVDYFRRNKVNASAHFFVDDVEVAGSVPWYNTAWHCGGVKMSDFGGTFYGKCKNLNSLGVEMCSRKDSAGAYYFTNETLNNAAELIAQLMKDYNIHIDRVIRHYDVTGKLCPRPLIDERTWKAFKELVMRKYNRTEVETVKYFEKLEDIPEGELRNTISELVEKGVIKGNGKGLHLSEDMVRTIVFCKRMIS